MEMDFAGAFGIEYGWMVDFSRIIEMVRITCFMINTILLIYKTNVNLSHSTTPFYGLSPSVAMHSIKSSVNHVVKVTMKDCNT